MKMGRAITSRCTGISLRWRSAKSSELRHYSEKVNIKLHDWKTMKERIDMQTIQSSQEFKYINIWKTKNKNWNTSFYFARRIFIILLMAYPCITVAQVQFQDDFNGDLSGWNLINDVHALVKNSEKWGAVRVEAQILFPDDKHNYFGLIYNYTQENSRIDFGSIYIKGNGSYIRANPWRDGNASRLLYEEYKTQLIDDQAIKINKWHNIKAEILGNVCHFYVGDMSTPKLTFDLFEKSSGLVGFKPRVTGWPVWVDNVKVTSIRQLNYNGPNIPMVDYEPDSLLTSWESIGPFRRHIKEIERASRSSKSIISVDDQVFTWKPFVVDKRGAVITGRLSEYAGERSVAYFRTTIPSDIQKTVVLHFSTTDEISFWVNGRFYGFIYRDGYVSLPQNDWNAWYDFWKNPEHAGRKVSIDFEPGENQIVIRIKNGQFASGGFFVRKEIP
jgi:hypothetical protein